MYIKITNGQIDKFPYTVGQLRRDNPNISFPKIVSDAELSSFGVYVVENILPPSFDTRTQQLVQDVPSFVDEKWVVGWSVIDKTADEIAQETQAKAYQLRLERNRKLAELDWTQGKDIPDSISIPAATYRQALRDITTQAGFPWEITWPTQG